MKSAESNVKISRLKADDLVIDLQAGTVRKGGDLLALPNLSWQMLTHFVLHAEAVISADDLISAVWGHLGVSNETLAQRVKLLRKELGDDGQSPRYIRTIRGRGYQFLPKIEPAEREKPAPQAKWLAAVIGGVVLALLSLLYFSPGEDRTSETTSSAEQELQRLLERGGEYLSRLQNEDNERAIALYGNALSIDPDSSEALIGLSLAYTHRSTKFNYPSEWAKRGEVIARQAIENGAKTARGWHALAFTLDAQDQIDDAIRYYERALALNPDHAPSLGSAAYLYYVRGSLSKALDYAERAYALNPNMAFGEVQLSLIYHALERDANASEWLQKALTLQPDNVFGRSVQAQIYFSHGRFDDAMTAIELAEAEGIRRSEIFVVRGLIYAMQGQGKEARMAFDAANAIDPAREIGLPYLVWLDVLSGVAGAEDAATSHIESVMAHRAGGAHHPAPLLIVAGLYASLGKNAAAFDNLSLSVNEGFRDWRHLNHNPMFVGLRGDARFDALLEDIRSRISSK